MKTKGIGTSAVVAITIIIAIAGIGGYFVSKGGEEKEGVPAPAKFEVSNLTFYPSEVEVGESVTISATVKNVGDLEGTYTVELKIDGEIQETRDVTLAGGATETVSFMVTRDASGTYTIGVNGLQRALNVLTPATFELTNLSINPSQVEPGESVTISVNVKNEGDMSGTYTVTLRIDGATESTQDVTLAGGESRTVSFTTSKSEAQTYNVSVDGLTGTFTVLGPAGIGEWTTDGRIELSVHSFSTASSVDYYPYTPDTAGYIWAWVDLSLKNVSSGTVSTNSLYAYLKDTQNYLYEREIVLSPRLWQLMDLPPGETLRGEIYFEVPSGAVIKEFIWSDYYSYLVIQLQS